MSDMARGAFEENVLSRLEANNTTMRRAEYERGKRDGVMEVVERLREWAAVNRREYLEEGEPRFAVPLTIYEEFERIEAELRGEGK